VILITIFLIRVWKKKKTKIVYDRDVKDSYNLTVWLPNQTTRCSVIINLCAARKVWAHNLNWAFFTLGYGEFAFALESLTACKILCGFWNQLIFFHLFLLFLCLWLLKSINFFSFILCYFCVCGFSAEFRFNTYHWMRKIEDRVWTQNIWICLSDWVGRVPEIHATEICLFDDDACWIKEYIFVCRMFK